MTTHYFCRTTVRLITAALTVCLLGCEGIGRRHDPRVLDLHSPPDSALPGATRHPAELPNFPDLVERMLATQETLLTTREAYFTQLRELERGYLLAGDTVKANWARRQRRRLEDVDVEAYPYLAAAPPEQSVEVAPEQQIAEADKLYEQAITLLAGFRSIPFAGHLPHNKKKAHKALELFKRILRDHPKSDKVDDCAFYCGEIYKEYLRDDDPNNELAVRYYQWAFSLDPKTPHAARFQCAVVYDFRRHDRARALELYHQVLDTEEDGNLSNMRFAASRIGQLTDDEFSHLRPQVATGGGPRPLRPVDEPRAEPVPITAKIPGESSSTEDAAPSP